MSSYNCAEREIHLCIVNSLCLIDSTVQLLIDINSDKESMSNLINSAKEFANSLEVDSESDYIIHRRRRLVPKRLDSQTSTQDFMNMQSFYLREFKLVLDTLIPLSNENLKNCVSSIQPLFQMFV